MPATLSLPYDLRSYESLKLILNGHKTSHVYTNVMLLQEQNYIEVKLHGNTIMIYEEFGHTYITDADWHTALTKRVLNAFLVDMGAQIYTKKGTWFLRRKDVAEDVVMLRDYMYCIK